MIGLGPASPSRANVTRRSCKERRVGAAHTPHEGYEHTILEFARMIAGNDVLGGAQLVFECLQPAADTERNSLLAWTVFAPSPLDLDGTSGQAARALRVIAAPSGTGDPTPRRGPV